MGPERRPRPLTVSATASDSASFSRRDTTMRIRILLILTFALSFHASIGAQQSSFDVVIKNGMVYDGTGAKPRRADIGVKGDKIVAVGDLKSAKATTVVDAQGLAVAPGFINMLSWAVD